MPRRRSFKSFAGERRMCLSLPARLRLRLLAEEIVGELQKRSRARRGTIEPCSLCMDATTTHGTICSSFYVP
jgi:hypothetical protein